MPLKMEWILQPVTWNLLNQGFLVVFLVGFVWVNVNLLPDFVMLHKATRSIGFNEEIQSS